ncbi:MAG: sugar phosphate isomerase/epimerase, partial [Verrucomicrobiia bacterium]
MQTRRTFLQTVPALAALPALAKDAKKPPAKDEGLTLGFSLYGMKTLKTGDALMRLNAIGYDSVEFCLNPGWDAAPDKLTPKRRRALRALLGHFELTLTALMVNCSLAGNQ